MNSYDLHNLASSLKYWAKDRQRRSGLPTTADQLIARAKKRHPTLTLSELDFIYQIAG